MKKVSDWLTESIGSHDIAPADKLASDFTAETGEEPCWSTHTVAETRKAIASRGLGGNCGGQPKLMVVWGFEVAQSLAMKYAGFRSTKLGRGSLYWDCVDALRKAGK